MNTPPPAPLKMPSTQQKGRGGGGTGRDVYNVSGKECSTFFVWMSALPASSAPFVPLMREAPAGGPTEHLGSPTGAKKLAICFTRGGKGGWGVQVAS